MLFQASLKNNYSIQTAKTCRDIENEDIKMKDIRMKDIYNVEEGSREKD